MAITVWVKLAENIHNFTKPINTTATSQFCDISSKSSQVLKKCGQISVILNMKKAQEYGINDNIIRLKDKGP